mgnify:CR=1 FL=1
MEYRPRIKGVIIEPNPVNAKGNIKIVAQVIDKEIIPRKMSKYCGEIYVGQQIGVI